MQKIAQKIRKTGSSYLIHNTKEDMVTVIKYCNMLADKVNELNEELQETQRELEKVRQMVYEQNIEADL